jgi:hypothetical protein
MTNVTRLPPETTTTKAAPSSNASDMLSGANPANNTQEPKGNRRARIPMSVVMRKLEAPEIPGYHTHWFKTSNISRALAAYYEFVEDDEVILNQRNPGIDTEVSGNTDLGSRVSIPAGIGADDKPERLYLMKLAEVYWLEDRAKIDSRNASLMGQIFRGEKIIDKDEVSKDIKETRYVDMDRTSEKRALFSRRRAKM